MTSTHDSKFILFQLPNRLDLHGGINLTQQLAAIEPQRDSVWVLDMASVESIDSVGVLALVNSIKFARQHQCRLMVCNVRPAVRLVFEITQLDQILENVDRELTAIETSVQLSHARPSLNSQLVAA